jgi:hypothetical protein
VYGGANPQDLNTPSVAQKRGDGVPLGLSCVWCLGNYDKYLLKFTVFIQIFGEGSSQVLVPLETHTFTILDDAVCNPVSQTRGELMTLWLGLIKYAC